MFDRAQVVAFVALGIGCALCFLALRSHSACFKSRMVSWLANRFGDRRAFQFVLVVGLAFCGFGIAIAWLGR